MPVTVETTDGTVADVLTPGDVWAEVKWFITVFGVVILGAMGTGLLSAADTRSSVRAIQTTQTQQDRALGGNGEAPSGAYQIRSEVNDLKNEMRRGYDSLETILSQIRTDQQSVLRAVGVKRR